MFKKTVQCVHRMLTNVMKQSQDIIKEAQPKTFDFFQLTGGLTDDLIAVYIFFVRGSIKGGAHLCIGDRTEENGLTLHWGKFRLEFKKGRICYIERMKKALEQPPKASVRDAKAVGLKEAFGQCL